ncbi:MAG: DUF4432 family protein [Spirochaetales bacterium]|nr:DUF4432 family protein [Spirochaetales bacterium]
MKKIGSLRQLAGTRHSMLTEGAANGTRVIDVNTGAGLTFTVLPDRGLDIGAAAYRGINFTYLSPQEEMNPAFCRVYKNEWLRTFFGGLLTTCGPTSFGPYCIDGEEELGLHGRFNCMPASHVCDRTSVESGEIIIEGVINDFVLFGAKVSIKRSILCEVGSNKITLCDTVKNLGGGPAPYMMLYHINFGYPFLDEETRTQVNSCRVEGYNAYSTEYIKEVNRFHEPRTDAKEKNYLHYFDSDEGIAKAINDAFGFCVSIRFNTNVLPYLSQWKYEQIRDYVLALEPCSSPCISRRELREKGHLKYIDAGETVVNTVTIEVGDTT